MDILIIGGLLVIGIGAIVALFFVLRSDSTPRAKAPAAMPQTAREAPPTPTTYESTPQREELHDGTPQTQAITRVVEPPQTQQVSPVAETRTVPVPPVAQTVAQDGATRVQPVTQSEQPLRVHLNGQFHELASGLRSLQQQATEMEQRLSSLNQMLEGIERNQPEER